MTLRAPVLLLFTVVPPAMAVASSLNRIRDRRVLRATVKNEGAADRSEHNDPAHFQKRGIEVELPGFIAAHVLGDVSKPDVENFPRNRWLTFVADGPV